MESSEAWHPSPECPCNVCRAQATGKPITSAQSQAYIDGVRDWWNAYDGAAIFREQVTRANDDPRTDFPNND